jgi:uncharacterized protein YeaO (DUF488 family)
MIANRYEDSENNVAPPDRVTREGFAEATDVSRRNRSLPLILTIGHSHRSIADFISLLKAHGIQRVIDVRTIPRSRHNPQFNRDALAKSLRASRIAYTHHKKLGGLRHPRPDSPNLGWHNASFRGFADYMQTPEFAAALARGESLARTKRCALMCAEAVPWRCHRSLIADALTIRGHAVEHIMTPTRANRHVLTPFARVRGRHIIYPASRLTQENKSPKEGKSMIQIARVYDLPKEKSGSHFLVERLWPRGMKKESLHLDAWVKDVAPSQSLRTWYSHRVERWPEFRKRYLAELRAHPAAWKPLLEAARRGNVTLLYAARDTEHNSALLLRDFLRSKL